MQVADRVRRRLRIAKAGIVELALGDLTLVGGDLSVAIEVPLEVAVGLAAGPTRAPPRAR